MAQLSFLIVKVTLTSFVQAAEEGLDLMPDECEAKDCRHAHITVEFVKHWYSLLISDWSTYLLFLYNFYFLLLFLERCWLALA